MNVIIGIKHDDNQEKFQKLVSFLSENEIETSTFSIDSPRGLIGRLSDALLTENIKELKEINEFTNKSKYHK